MSLVAYAASDDSDSEFEEQEIISTVTPSNSVSAPGNAKERRQIGNSTEEALKKSKETSHQLNSDERKSMLNLPKPKENFKKDTAEDINANDKVSREKIKIPMFSFKFRQIDSDDDLDDDEGKRKSTTGPSKKGSGLMALLPKPRNSVSLGGSSGGSKIKAKNSKSNNLIPYTLTKAKDKKAEPSNTITKGKETKPASLVSVDQNISDDDDTEDPTEFFSFHQKPESNLNVDEVLPVEADQPSTSEGIHKMSTSSDNIISSEQVSDQFSDVTAPYGSTEENINYEVYNEMQNVDQQQVTNTYHEAPQQPSEQLQLDDEALRQLQGRRKRKEEIHIIDVNGADQQCSAEQYLKNITEHTGYSSKKAKKDLPSMTKKKHQITYLAMQAKEREFELQNEWSSNRTTKRQTQQRYGF